MTTPACISDSCRYNIYSCRYPCSRFRNRAVSEHDLPNAELDVMRCLWQGQPLTAREVREELGGERPMTHSSVSTLLRRLEAKGFVARDKGDSGKAFFYRAAVPPTRTRRRKVHDLLKRLFA